jgi:hypothetical protein
MIYEIEIRIDLLTYCLFDRESEKNVDTHIHRVHPKNGEYKWSFNWTILENGGYEVYALKVVGDEEAQGLLAIRSDEANSAIECKLLEANPNNVGHAGKYVGVGAHLMAFACKTAAERKFDACFFIAKTNLIEHYTKTLGAKQVGRSQKMIIEGAAFRELLNRYYKEEKDHEN